MVMSTRTYLPSIPVAGSQVSPLIESDQFGLSCGTKGCSSNCCKNGPPIVLNPNEIARICKEGGLFYEDFLDIVETERINGFPLVMLPREPRCYFWTESGCSIYQARPLACRLFPLGRVFHDGRSHIVLPERNICMGLVQSSNKTVEDYLKDQDTRIYIEMSDRWIEFVTEMERLGLPDRPVTSIAFHMLVYSPDAPPAVGFNASETTPEERFMLRLAAAREQLPRSLGRAKWAVF